MERSNGWRRRVAAGPISWGVCEVPGWGVMLPAERVLAEMADIGVTGTELGAPGFLPTEPAELAAMLDRHGLRLAGAFLPVVLHDPAERSATLANVRRAAALLGDCEQAVLVTAVVADVGWSPRRQLRRGEWQHLTGMLAELDEVCEGHGVRHAVHPHAGTLVEMRDDVRAVMDRSTVDWCLDTGHLLIGGYDPVEFADDASGRVVHVHLKDARAELVARYRRGELTLIEAVRSGMFCVLGAGDAPIAATVERLEADSYDGWYVLEQDTDLGPTAPSGAGPIDDVRASLEFLDGVLLGGRTG